MLFNSVSRWSEGRRSGKCQKASRGEGETAAEDAVRQSCSQLSVVLGAFLHRCTSLQHVLNNTRDYFIFFVLRESLDMKWNKTRTFGLSEI